MIQQLLTLLAMNKWILLTFSLLVFAGCNGKYEMGDFYKDNDTKGIVVQVDGDGRAVLVLSLDEAVNINADSAFIWAEQFDGGDWHLPTKEEMTTIRKYKNLVNSTLERKGYNTILTNHTFYWTGTPCSESHTYACGPDGIKCYFNQNLSSCYRARAVKRIDKQI